MEPGRLPLDVIAGITLAALAIPEVMGYARIAGMPVVTGLYTLLLPVVAFAILGSSRHLVVGADSATAAILATALLATGAVSGSPEYTALAGVAALMCGALLILARVLRLGFIANFLSRSVLIGFLTGVGIQVAMGQVGGMFGITGQTGGTLEKFAQTLAAIPTQTSVATLAVSIAVLATILGFERFAKAIPGALIAVIGAIALSYVLDLSAKGVTLLGPVPGGLPGLVLPTNGVTLDQVVSLLPSVISLVVVILAQSAATSRAYAMRYGDSFDENLDLVGLGVANVAASITGTFVVNGSPTKTEMVDSAGGRSQISQLTAGAVVVVVLLFLTGPLSYLPNAVLASVVFLIGIRLIDVAGMRDIARLRVGEFVVAVITAAVVVVVGVEQGIILAMALSIIEHISHSYSPYDTLQKLGARGRENSALDTNVQAAPGLVVYSFGAGLYYANANRFSEEILTIVENAKPPLKWLAVSCDAVGDIDYSGSESLSKIVPALAARGVTLVLCDIPPQVRKQLDEYGLTATIGADHLFGSLRDLLDSYTPPDASPPADANAPASTDAEDPKPS
jgi:sulfate permease, SulP family